MCRDAFVVFVVGGESVFPIISLPTSWCGLVDCKWLEPLKVGEKQSNLYLVVLTIIETVPNRSGEAGPKDLPRPAAM